ncbi:hypothetical protein PVA48_14730 [Akkermansia sp. JRP_AM1]|uniref:hypothetical protein n=1 Tax=Akkermansia sp. JRP_AM1 TaxID=3414159 RepID=UPI003BFA77F0
MVGYIRGKNQNIGTEVAVPGLAACFLPALCNSCEAVEDKTLERPFMFTGLSWVMEQEERTSKELPARRIGFMILRENIKLIRVFRNV